LKQEVGLKTYLFGASAALALLTCPGLQAGTARAQTAPAPAGAAQAAPSSSDAAALPELIVTARKRTEDVQKIADPTTVVTSAMIERADVQNIQDVARLTPNLVIYDQLVPGIQNISFRGFTTVQGGQSPFTVVVDGVEEPGQEFLKQELVDIDQVEVLRGPQGTLYGANAIAGAINITTKQPTNAYEASAQAGYFQGNAFEGTITLSGPIVADKVFFRASAYGLSEDGLIPNLANPKVDADFARDQTYQGELLFKPAPDLDVDVRAHFVRDYDGALWLSVIPNADFATAAPDPDENTNNTIDRNLQMTSIKIDYRMPWATLTSITGYDGSQWFAYADGDFSPAAVATQDWIHRTAAESEELRLTSPGDGRLRWNLGLFVQDGSVKDLTDFYTGGFDFNSYNSYHSDSYAGFGQATYDFTPKFQGTFGFRYDVDVERAVDLLDGTPTSKTFSDPQPKVTLTYKLAPDILSYFTYSQGFRTGGFNPTSPLALRIYKNETANNYEVGLKSEWLERRLIVNADVFRTDFQNQQFFFSEATLSGIYRVITNIPQTEVTGGELEVAARPFQHLTVQGSVGYNNTDITKFPSAPEDQGNRTPQVYALTSNLSLDYTHPVPLGSSAMFIGHFDWQHRGNVYWDLANTLETPPRDFLNTRLALEFNGKYSVAFVGRNLTSARTPSAVGADSEGATTSLASYNEPRQVGFELQARY
jgi:iron complex outermembrane receptor protein